MNEARPSDLPGGVAGALGTLRHALADPLSAAGLKLELLERRLRAESPGGPLLDRVGGVKAELAAAGRLIDLLPRLASLAGEVPEETSLDELLRAAGIPPEEDGVPLPRLVLRRQSTVDALRTVAWFLRPPDTGTARPRIRAEVARGRVSLRIEAFGGRAGTDPERLFHLPRGQERTEELFLARAGIEADGGRFDLSVQDDRMIALLSWPRAPLAGETEARS